MLPIAEPDLPPGRVIEWVVRPSSENDPAIGAVESTKRPSFTQELYYHLIEWQSRLHPGRLAVWVAATFEIDGPVELDALRKTFRQLLVRHEVLRTEFRMRPDQDGTHGLFGLLACDVLNPDTLVLEDRKSVV